jgi:hypothetical protein
VTEYYAQAIPEPIFCLGLQLKPLTVGHLLLLNRLESAFVCEHKPDADPFQELALGVAVCAQSYADGVAMLHDPKTPMAMALWAQRLTRTRFIDRLLRRHPRIIDIAAECDTFREYMRSNTKVPHYTYNPKDSVEIACPSVQQVRACLQRAFGLSDDAILNRSWQQCLWDFVTLKALDNQIQMTDPEAITSALEVGKRIAEALAKKGVQVNGAS